MKKAILCLFVLLTAGLMAQQNMTFKGVEIDGPLDKFVKALEAEGFAREGEENGVVVMRGDFAGYNDCEIAVISSEEDGGVDAVGVMFHEREEWPVIEVDYNRLKEMLTAKYGRPYPVVEEFQGRTFDDNKIKFSFLTSDRCKWISIFEMDRGRIELFMQQTSEDKAAVILKYYDYKNTDVTRSSIMDDL